MLPKALLQVGDNCSADVDQGRHQQHTQHAQAYGTQLPTIIGPGDLLVIVTASFANKAVALHAGVGTSTCPYEVPVRVGHSGLGLAASRLQAKEGTSAVAGAGTRPIARRRSALSTLHRAA